MQLYLVRHAESENNAHPPHRRVEDPSLTRRGRLQAEHLASWTRTLRIDVLITSPFLRTLQTTRRIVDATPQRLHIWHDVFERGGCYKGHLPDNEEGALGLGRQDILRHATGNPEACLIDETISDHGWWGGRPRESEQEATIRCGAVIGRLTETFGNNGQTVVLVTHADFKRLLVAAMLGGSLDPQLLGPMRNTGITKVNYDGERWQLDWFNSISHLPSRLITGCE